MRKAWRRSEENRISNVPRTNVYREQHLRELLEVSRRPDVKLSVSQVETLLKWQETPADDVRRLVATLDVDQRLTVLRNAAPRRSPEAA